MTIDPSRIIEEYLKWIKDNTLIRSVSNGVAASISTPFLDRHNDHLEIYINKIDNHFHLTDDGYTVHDLEMSGLTLNSPKREQIFKSILVGFGIKLGERDELYTEATLANIGQKKHYLLQAMLAVNDMYTLSQENILSLFKEDVELYLRSGKIFFNKDIKIGGKSGFDHNIDFIIPPSQSRPERLIRTINNPQKNSISATIFSFNDIAALREESSQNYVIYNDNTNYKISAESLSALENYNVKSIPWSNKERCLEEFALV